tara:strand:+ start:2363 stop:2596 length:234 start_codon:yes stop_codon:yes gene_type:complete
MGIEKFFTLAAKAEAEGDHVNANTFLARGWHRLARLLVEEFGEAKHGTKEMKVINDKITAHCEAVQYHEDYNRLGPK